MDPALVILISASLAFVGSHFALSHPLRAPLVRMLGAGGFLGLYSVVALATFGWMVFAFRAVAPYGVVAWTGNDEVSWTLASVLTVVALVLFLGSLRGNPALPGVVIHPEGAQPEPVGVFRVTRHPMMWGFALWGLAHVIVAPTARTLVLGLAIATLALVGAHLQDRKKQTLIGKAWAAWEAKTSYWPRWSALPGAGLALWALSIVLWLAITWAHVWLAYVPAGIWRWVG
jgi:uncharacterized membrane protein